MKTGIMTGAYFGMAGSESGFRKMKEHGYDCADYQNLMNMNDKLYSCSAGEFEAYLRRERDNARSAGIEISQVHAPWPTDDTSPEKREAKLEAMKKAIYGTYLLGCSDIVIHPVMPFGWGDEPDPAESRKLNIGLFTALLPTAKEYGVYLNIENMPMTKLSLSRVGDICGLIDELDSPFVGMCLDTGHCSVFGDDPGEMVRLAGPRLRTLHVHDNNGKSDLHWLPYTGVIKWESFRDALSEANFAGALSIETAVSAKYPLQLREYMQIGLLRTARYLAGQSI